MSKLLLCEEVAALLRVSPDTVRDMVREGRLRAARVRPRGRLLFEYDDVMTALKTVAGPCRIEAAGGGITTEMGPPK